MLAVPRAGTCRFVGKCRCMSYHFHMRTHSGRRLFSRPSLGIALLAALGVTACGHPVQKKLEGRWLGDGVENFDDEAVATATGWARGASMEFAGSSLTVTIPAEEPRSGKYKVVSVHEGDV